VLKESLADAARRLEFPISPKQSSILFPARGPSAVREVDKLRRWSRIKKHLTPSGEKAGP
jgi:hypothetical protein